MHQTNSFMRPALFVCMMLAAAPAAASDFSGFITIFVGFPALVFFNLLLGMIASCRAIQSGSVRARWILLICIAGILVLGRWFSVLITDSLWVVWVSLFLLLAVIFFFLCSPDFKTKKSQVNLTMARTILLLSIASCVFMFLDMVQIVSKKDDAGILLYLVPCLFLLAIAFKIYSWVVTREKGGGLIV